MKRLKYIARCLIFKWFENQYTETANNLDDVKTAKIRRLKISNNLDMVPNLKVDELDFCKKFHLADLSLKKVIITKSNF